MNWFENIHNGKIKQVNIKECKSLINDYLVYRLQMNIKPVVLNKLNIALYFRNPCGESLNIIDTYLNLHGYLKMDHVDLDKDFILFYTSECSYKNFSNIVSIPTELYFKTNKENNEYISKNGIDTFLLNDKRIYLYSEIPKIKHNEILYLINDIDDRLIIHKHNKKDIYFTYNKIYIKYITKYENI